MNALKGLCAENGIEYNDFEDITVNQGLETTNLFHGSKSGITGRSKPNSGEHFDFGKGFYIGTER